MTARAYKGPLGLVLASMAAVSLFAGHRLAGECLAFVAVFLLGAGFVKDDRTEQLEHGQYVRMPRP